MLHSFLLLTLWFDANFTFPHIQSARIHICLPDEMSYPDNLPHHPEIGKITVPDTLKVQK
jgi:hypothetical protein